MAKTMRRLVLLLTVAAALAAAGSASAAQLIDRDATGVKLAVNAKGEALLTYRAAGRLKHVLVWGAVNARTPNKDVPQVKFQKDYSGGWGKYRKLYWQGFPNVCTRYDGPSLPNVVAACKAGDGSYWAAQSWPQPLPDLGYTPWTPALRADWLEVSHWTGPVAQLDVYVDWVNTQKARQVFGRYTWGGVPVFGFGTSRYGAPSDGYGRLIYLDTLNAPKYGSGWRRENSFVPHNPTGVWCYEFYSYDPTGGGYIHPPGQTGSRGPGVGEKYRLIAAGPGVTPNVAKVVDDPGDYDPSNPQKVAFEQQQNGVLDSILAGDKLCRQH